MNATVRVRQKSADAVQANIAKALAEVKSDLGLTFGQLQKLTGLDDSTIAKVLDASRNIQFDKVSALVDAYNEHAGDAFLTPDKIILKYNTPDEVARLPPRLGFQRFLNRHRQVPQAPSAAETADVLKLVVDQPRQKTNGHKMADEIEITESIIRVYTIEPMVHFKFVAGETYAVRLNGETKVMPFPFNIGDHAGEFEVLGRVTSHRIK